MGLFGLGKKKEILDLSERYKKQQEKIAQIHSDNQEEISQSSSQGGAFDFLSNLSSGSNQSPEETESNSYVDVSEGVDKRKKLAKRFMEMTNKIEDLSNQIYHLQQRIEVLERKSGVGAY